MNRLAALVLLALSALPAFAQAPADRPQPNQASYSTTELQQFATFTREAYRAKFGAAAPACDPSRPLKLWFDRTVDLNEPENIAVYRVLGQDSKGFPAIRQLAMTNAAAASVNLPGREVFPSYTPSPTAAAVLNAFTGAVASGIEPGLLSTKDQATAYAAQFGGHIEEEIRGGSFPYFYPPSESRRIWVVIDASGHRYYAGSLLAQENRSGIGAPGAWIQNSERLWTWQPDAIPDCAGKTDQVPVPVRGLLPNEQLAAGLAGPHVVRTDKQLQLDQASGLFTAEDRALLRAIAAALGIK